MTALGVLTAAHVLIAQTTTSAPIAIWEIPGAYRLRIGSQNGQKTAGGAMRVTATSGQNFSATSMNGSSHTSRTRPRQRQSVARRLRISWFETTILSESADFSIVAPIQVVLPRAGQQLTANGEMEVRFTHAFPPGQVFIVNFSADGGRTWSLLDSGRAAATPDGAFRIVNSGMVWVPNKPGTNALVRVSASGDVSTGGDSGQFTVVPTSLTVATPSGWAIGQVLRKIEWTHNLPDSTLFIVALSRDGGATWTPLTESYKPGSTLGWTVTGPPTYRARVRVSKMGPGSVHVESDDFTIAP